jgi:hypothetical protein
MAIGALPVALRDFPRQAGGRLPQAARSSVGTFSKPGKYVSARKTIWPPNGSNPQTPKIIWGLLKSAQWRNGNIPRPSARGNCTAFNNIVCRLDHPGERSKTGCCPAFKYIGRCFASFPGTLFMPAVDRFFLFIRNLSIGKNTGKKFLVKRKNG